MRISAAILLLVEAVAEGVTGVALIVFPAIVCRVLFAATDLPVLAAVAARICGIAVLALALGCWFGARGHGAVVAIAAMLLYNLGTTAYLAALGVEGELVGVLLWPAVAFHAAMVVLLAVAGPGADRPEARVP